MALTQTTTGAINQIMAVDGTTAVLDAIHNLAFTKTGGVGNAWPGDSSNFCTLLGSAQAPVIAPACDNLLSDENASFEGGTAGTWVNLSNCSFAASTNFAWHGVYSGKMTVTANGQASCYQNITALTSAGSQYTASGKIKGVVGKTYTLKLYDNVSNYTSTPSLTADGTWQTLSVTKTFNAGSTVRRMYLWADSVALASDVVYWSGLQLETGAVQTPFALDSRTACLMTIPTATIGLTAGMGCSFLAVINSPWAGNDEIQHYIMDAKGAGAGDVFSIYKHSDNKLYFAVGNKSAVTAALTTTTWPANTNRFVIGTVSAAGAINIYNGGTAGTAASGATREAALNANLYAGTKIDGTLQVNAAEFLACWGRVLSAGEITALSAAATWASVIDLPQITVTGLATGNAVRLYDAAGNIHASAVEAGGTATLTYALD